MTEGAANASVVRSMYTPMASDYEEIWAPLLRPYGRRLLDMLPLDGARRVLDLGCGVGRLLHDIEERAPRALVVGSDLTEGMLRLAPARFARAVMDGTRLGFAEEAFDAVVSAFALFHFPDPGRALEGVRRVVRAGGGVAIAVWGTSKAFPALDAWNEELDAAQVPSDPAADGPPDGEDQVNSKQKITGLLAQAGFVDVLAESAEWRQAWDAESFAAWRLRMGPSRRRLEQLDPPDRDRVVARASERVAGMSAQDLVDHDEVVVASGRARVNPREADVRP